MIDMSKTTAAKSDQLNSDDLIGGPKTVKITGVSPNENSLEQPINVFFDGDGGKPFRPCKGMRRLMMQIWGIDGTSYVGRSMTLFRDPSVTWGGLAVGGIRVSHMSHMDRETTVAITESKTKRRPMVVKVLPTPAPTRETAPAASDPAAEQAALAAADEGRAAFKTWWNSDYGKANRESVAGVIAECNRRSAAWESANAVTETDEPPM